MDIIAKARLNAENVRELPEHLLREQPLAQVEGYKITTNLC